MNAGAAQRHRRRAGRGAAAGCILALTALSMPGPGPTAGTPANTDATQALPEFSHGLENRRFVGTWTYEWDRDSVEGVFIFEDGRFVSQGCLEWGYEPAPYYVRRDEAGVHFFARLPNPEHGTMKFRGVFDGERLRADVHWKKERWYWTLEQRYRFTGKPLEASE